jgi:putative hydrolase of HD superfamily
MKTRINYKKKTKKEFDKILEFVTFLNNFRLVERVQSVVGLDRKENDSEHSYIFTMYAWYVCNIFKLKLNVNKVIKYCLVHDLVETYAGDVGFWEKGELVNNKKEKEHEAYLKIKRQFSNFKELSKTILDYENKKDKEAKFVYALDKTIDVVEIFLENGKCWKEYVPEATFDKHLQKKREKIKEVEPAKSINEELHKRIQEIGILKFFNQL